MMDIENLVARGVIQKEPEYCPLYKNWKYRINGTVDDRLLEVVIALDPTEDYAESPLAILLTAYVKQAVPQQ